MPSLTLKGKIVEPDRDGCKTTTELVKNFDMLVVVTGGVARWVLEAANPRAPLVLPAGSFNAELAPEEVCVAAEDALLARLQKLLDDTAAEVAKHRADRELARARAASAAASAAALRFTEDGEGDAEAGEAVE